MTVSVNAYFSGVCSFRSFAQNMLSEDLLRLRTSRNVLGLPWNISSVNFNSHQYLTRQIFQKNAAYNDVHVQTTSSAMLTRTILNSRPQSSSILPFYVIICRPISRFFFFAGTRYAIRPSGADQQNNRFVRCVLGDSKKLWRKVWANFSHQKRVKKVKKVLS